jgi:hypothetical protein
MRLELAPARDDIMCKLCATTLDVRNYSELLRKYGIKWKAAIGSPQKCKIVGNRQAGAVRAVQRFLPSPRVASGR